MSWDGTRCRPRIPPPVLGISRYILRMPPVSHEHDANLRFQTDYAVRYGFSAPSPRHAVLYFTV